MKLKSKTGIESPSTIIKLKNFIMQDRRDLFKSCIDGGVGQLSFKEEAAGKLRIFAMVDIWTQSIFKPLHDFLFSVLKALPNDGTFDQNESFKRAQIKSIIRLLLWI
jgi:hypothetical protein